MTGSGEEVTPNGPALKRNARILVITSVLFFVALLMTCPQVLFFANPYTLHAIFLIANLLMPLVGLAYSSLQIKTPKPWLFFVFFLPSVALLLDGFFEGTHLNHFRDLLLPAAAVSGTLMLIFLVFLLPPMKLEKREATAATVLFVLLCSAFYGLIAIRSLNWGLDQSAPTIFQARVVTKETFLTSEDETEYWLNLEKWEGMDRSVAIRVALSMYNSTSEGDYVKVLQKKGVLNIPRYYFVIFTAAVR